MPSRLFLLLALCAPFAARAQFTPAAKPDPLPLYSNAARATFGYINVPENRANPTGRQIQLAVIVVAARSATPKPDPVFYIVGGPGGSATLSSSGFPIFQELNQDRDIVFLDPRGAGFSEPNLFMRRNNAATIAKFTSDNRRYFRNQGIDITAYNTTEIASDYEAARIALGYTQINLFANSYGTFVAQEILRRFPGNLRSVVMSGNLPATDSFLPTTLPIENHGINALLADVRQTRPARRAFPNLRQRFYKLIRALRTRPVELTLDNADTGKPEAVTIDDKEFTQTVTELLQQTSTIRLIPLLVQEFERKNYHSLVRRLFAPRLELQRDNPFGMYLSVLGTDFAAPGYLKATERGILSVHNPMLVRAEGLGIFQLAQIIVNWSVPYNPSTTRTLPTSSVRTLFLNGQMDAQTAVTGGATIAAGISNSINYIYPRIGHGVGFDYGPDLTAAIAFINDPTQAPAYSVGSLMRRHFYKTRQTSAKARGVDDWRDYLTDLPAGRFLTEKSTSGE